MWAPLTAMQAVQHIFTLLLPSAALPPAASRACASAADKPLRQRGAEMGMTPAGAVALLLAACLAVAAGEEAPLTAGRALLLVHKVSGAWCGGGGCSGACAPGTRSPWRRTRCTTFW